MSIKYFKGTTVNISVQEIKLDIPFTSEKIFYK